MKRVENEQMREIGRRLYECRKRKKWTQAKVAEMLDVSVNTVSSIENGLQQFNVSMLLCFSEIYGVNADYILRGSLYGEQENPLVRRLSRLPIKEQKRMIEVIDTFYK